jgi:hypothetical protein
VLSKGTHTRTNAVFGLISSEIQIKSAQLDSSAAEAFYPLRRRGNTPVIKAREQESKKRPKQERRSRACRATNLESKQESKKKPKQEKLTRVLKGRHIWNQSKKARKDQSKRDSPEPSRGGISSMSSRRPSDAFLLSRSHRRCPSNSIRSIYFREVTLTIFE